MIKGFWKKIADKAKKEKRPILASASMANVTDAAFRLMMVKYSKYDGKGVFDKNGKFTRPNPPAGGVGGPDVMWTEFVSCDGLCSGGKKNLMLDLIFDKSERPIVVQFFGAKPENFYKCALLAQKLGFDGIDINMGCPDRGVVRQGAGSALIKNPKLAQKIIKETIRGAGKLPVSVKTRIGFNELEYKKWIPCLLKMDIAALTIHGRTKKEMSDVPAHWDIIGDIVKMRNKLRSKTLIIGNGDVFSLADAQEKYEKYGVDGVMVGRGLFGTPWFFSGRRTDSLSLSLRVPPKQSDRRSSRAKRGDLVRLPRRGLPPERPKSFGRAGLAMTEKNKLKLALEHTKLFEKIFMVKNPSSAKATAGKHFDIMKKHYKAYVSGFDNAKKIRMRLMNVKSLDSAKKTLKDLISKV